MTTRWNAEADAAMRRRTAKNTPWNDGESYRPGDIIPVRVVYADSDRSFVWGMVAGALALGLGYGLPSIITFIWRSF